MKWFLIVLLIYLILYFWANHLKVFILDSNIPGPTILIVGGTHGNEPAGALAIEKLLDSGFKPFKGRIICIPRANRLGLALYTRWLPHRLWNRDLNRNYPREDGQIPLEPISGKICQYAETADFIIDLHEGWGYHLLTPESLGSGVYPGNTKYAIQISYRLADHLNQEITIPHKKFTVGLDNHPELNSLRSYCVLKGKNYILLETTGQYDIQPIEIRVAQQYKSIQFIIDTILS